MQLADMQLSGHFKPAKMLFGLVFSILLMNKWDEHLCD